VNTCIGVRAAGVATAEQLAGLTGLQRLEGMMTGDLPAPTMCETLGIRLTDAADGFAAFEGDTGGQLLNPQGTVHGGWALSLVDSACGCAALGAGVGFTTIETKVNFVRPILEGTGRVRCEATLVGRGKRIMSAEARVTGPGGRLLAHGTSTLLVLGREPG
jgi:uncharacterized protein (TIGR00369 family)